MSKTKLQMFIYGLDDAVHDEIAQDAGDTSGSKSVSRYDTTKLDRLAVEVRHSEMNLDGKNAEIRYAESKGIEIVDADREEVKRLEQIQAKLRHELQLMIRTLAKNAREEWAEWGFTEDVFDPAYRLINQE